MNCPACKDEQMIVMELDNVEIDYCLECQGVWLDAGELEILLDGSESKDALLSSFQKSTAAKEQSRKCPICLKAMDKVLVGENCDVLIDKCKKEHGLWFDAGELEDVLALGSLGNDTKVLALLKDMFGKNN